MTPAEYRRRTDEEWRGVKVRSRRPLSTQALVIPRGSIFTVERKFKGFSLRSEPCSCCGVAVRITKVPPSDVEEFDE